MILLSLVHKNTSNLIDQSRKIGPKILKISNFFVTQAAKMQQDVVVSLIVKGNQRNKQTDKKLTANLPLNILLNIIKLYILLNFILLNILYQLAGKSLVTTLKEKSHIAQHQFYKWS